MKTRSLIFNWVRYLVRNPVGLKWLLIRQVEPLSAKKPWCVYDAVDFLRRNLGSDICVFEWGSGGSTLFFEDFARVIMSIEHDVAWYERVKSLINNDITQLRLVLPEAPSVPVNKAEKRADNHTEIFPDYLDNKVPYNSFRWESYACQIECYEQQSFDVVMVDGRARPSCLFHAADKIKAQGILVLDNSERAAYSTALRLFDNWERKHFFGPAYDGSFTRTSIFFKP